MAEIIGAISGAITIGALATSVATSVKKLKSYWDRLEGAPDDIRRLIEEIEILSLVLDDIKDDQTQNPVSSLLLDGTALSRCLEHCRKAAERLRGLVDNMAASVESKGKVQMKWAATKVVLGKDRIERFKVDLEGAIRILSLSHQSYTRALLRLQPEIIAARFPQAITSSIVTTAIVAAHYQHQSSPPTFKSPSVTSRQNHLRVLSSEYFWESTSDFNPFGKIGLAMKHYLEDDRQEIEDIENDEKWREIMAWYRGPAWLVNRAWKLHASKASSGWDFTIRQYNIIPGNALIFHFACNGNISELQGLFDKHKASVYDCDGYGRSALHWAARHSQYSTCKLLIELGADANCKTNLGVKYRGPEEGFSYWQQHLKPHFYDESHIQERVVVAIALSANFIVNEAMLFRRTLSRDSIIPALAVSVRNSDGETLMHGISRAVGGTVMRVVQHSDTERDQMKYLERTKRRLAEWRILLAEVVNKGADLHATTSDHETAFTYLLKECEGFIHHHEDWIVSYPIVLKTWLTDLAACGVDLEAYGRREQELLQERIVPLKLGVTVWTQHLTLVPEDWYLVSFTYGRTPDDWNIVFEQVSEPDYTQAIPGSWVEDDEIQPSQSPFTLTI